MDIEKRLNFLAQFRDPEINQIKLSIQNIVNLYDEQQTAMDKLQEFKNEVRTFMIDSRKARPTADIKLPQKSGRDPKGSPIVIFFFLLKVLEARKCEFRYRSGHVTRLLGQWLY